MHTRKPDAHQATRTTIDSPSSRPLERSVPSLAAAFLIGITAFSSACFSEGADDPAQPEVRAESLIEIRLIDFAFTPARIIINRGARVRWINTTSTFHTVTPDGHSAWQRWPTSSVGDTLEHEFTSTGEFAYFCEPHRSIGMVGSIMVR